MWRHFYRPWPVHTLRSVKGPKTGSQNPNLFLLSMLELKEKVTGSQKLYQTVLNAIAEDSGGKHQFSSQPQPVARSGTVVKELHYDKVFHNWPLNSEGCQLQIGPSNLFKGWTGSRKLSAQQGSCCLQTSLLPLCFYLLISRPDIPLPTLLRHWLVPLSQD